MDDLNINPHQRSTLWLATAQRLPNPPRAARAVRSNMDVQEIREKYSVDSVDTPFGKIDVGVSKESANLHMLESLLVSQQRDKARYVKMLSMTIIPENKSGYKDMIATMDKLMSQTKNQIQALKSKGIK